MKEIKVRSHRTPIYRDSAFFLEDPSATRNAFEEELDHPRSPENYIYSRYRNPTVVSVEEQLMEIEGCQWALLTQSGMAAIDVALSIFQRNGETGSWLFFSEIYGGTNSYIDRILKYRRGIDIKRFYPSNDRYDLEALEKIFIEEKPQLVFFEAISNPMLIVADGDRIIEMARKHNVITIIDNTFATPYLWKPLKKGADIVIHSATKYLSGHNNITAGVVCGNNGEYLKEAIEYRKWIGHMLSPDDAYRLGTQLKTFELRFERHCRNAERLAKALASHPKIEKVFFPSLSTHPTYAEALSLFKGRGNGAMITFDIYGKTPDEKGENAVKFIRAVSTDIPILPSLGDTQTIILHVESVWGQKYPLPGMIRLSTGIEDYEKLENTILTSLEAI